MSPERRMFGNRPDSSDITISRYDILSPFEHEHIDHQMGRCHLERANDRRGQQDIPDASSADNQSTMNLPLHPASHSVAISTVASIPGFNHLAQLTSFSKTRACRGPCSADLPEC